MIDVKHMMDMKTAEWLADKAQNDPSVFPVEFQECPLCGAQYIEELGHDCNNVIELTWHEYEEGETEGMTNREAISLFYDMQGCRHQAFYTNDCGDCERCKYYHTQEQLDEAVDIAISALEKQGWHNARKDPPKRPDGMWDIYCVYTRFDRCGIAKYYAHGKWDGYDEDGDQIGEYEIIAYCNFPKPYTEEES